MKNKVGQATSINLIPNHVAFLLVVLLSCIFANGCGKSGLERASIRGNVSLDGAPVTSGSIRMVSLEESGGPSAGGDIVDGKYDIGREKGPSLGRHRVEVYIPYKTGHKIPSPMGGAVVVTEINPDAPQTGGAGTNQSEAGMVDAWSDKAPLKYNRESILEVNIVSGSNTFDVQMNSK